MMVLFYHRYKSTISYGNSSNYGYSSTVPAVNFLTSCDGYHSPLQSPMKQIILKIQWCVLCSRTLRRVLAGSFKWENLLAKTIVLVYKNELYVQFTYEYQTYGIMYVETLSDSTITGPEGQLPVGGGTCIKLDPLFLRIARRDLFTMTTPLSCSPTSRHQGLRNTCGTT